MYIYTGGIRFNVIAQRYLILRVALNARKLLYFWDFYSPLLPP